MSRREYEPRTLGWWMDGRRGQLGLTWDQLGQRAQVSVMTLRRNAESPTGMRTTTKKGIERALGWADGSVDKILRGEEPVIADNTPSAPASESDLDNRIAELQGMAAELAAYAERLNNEIQRLRSEQQHRGTNW